MKKYWIKFKQWCVRNWHIHYTRKAFKVIFDDNAFGYDEVLFDGAMYHRSLGKGYFRCIGFQHRIQDLGKIT